MTRNLVAVTLEPLDMTPCLQVKVLPEKHCEEETSSWEEDVEIDGKTVTKRLDYGLLEEFSLGYLGPWYGQIEP